MRKVTLQWLTTACGTELGVLEETDGEIEML